MTLLAGTMAIRPEEGAWDLQEMNLPPANFGPAHRFQIIRVVRNDMLVEHRTDMGLATTDKQLNILGGTIDAQGRGHVWETVASLRDYADNLRGKHYDWDDIDPLTTTDYSNMYQEEQDKQKRSRSGIKTTGSIYANGRKMWVEDSQTYAKKMNRMNKR